MKNRPCIILFLSVIIFPFLNLQAQSFSPKVIATSGGYTTNSSFGSLSYTVGEMAMVKTFSANGNMLTQGFQQPDDTTFATALTEVPKGEEGSVAVYPNPASTVLWFGYEFTQSGKINLLITDINGRQMPYHFSEQYEVGKVVRQLDCTLLASGEYFLSIQFTSASTKTISRKFQLLK